MAKVLVNKIKVILPKLISLNQSTFIPSRHITNNIVITKEMIHSMRTMKMKIKIDLEKAYAKLRWDFIGETLTEIQLPADMVNLVMEYITSVTYQIL